MNEQRTTDVLVVGAGIAGMQAALDLADRGYDVLLVEREATIGGKMIGLSKVFPTMDCASCITTPRMSATAHHDRITTWTYVEVESITPEAGGYRATITHKPRYVDEDACIGCRLCEYACPVEVPHEFDGGMGARRAVYIPFGTAMPQKALIEIDECVYCGKCEKACPTGAIDFSQTAHTEEVFAHSVVLATGYEPTPIDAKKEYLGGRACNVLSGLDMERLLAPNGPYGRVLRPSDGKIPESVAYIQCAGSRDETLGVPYCSRVCCMYAIKQAMLLSGSLPLADITIYYMDIRTFGKGYEQFYQTARSMGINFVKAKVGRIEENPNGDLRLRVEMIEGGGRVVEVEHDLVVLSVGLRPGDDARRFIDVELDPYGFVASSEPKLAAPLTNLPGVVAAGTALAPKDIVDTVVEASAAATAVALKLGPPVTHPVPAIGDGRAPAEAVGGAGVDESAALVAVATGKANHG